MTSLPQERIAIESGEWTVGRVWPARDKLAIEVSHADEAGVRAGWYTPGRVQLLAPGTDPKLKALKAFVPQGTVISHRPEKRAVIRHHDGEHFTKVVRRGRAAGVLAGIDRARCFDGPFRVPDVIGHDDSSVTLEAVEGHSLHEPGDFTADEWSRAWTEVFDAWEASLNRADQLAEDTPIHDAEAEAGVLEHWAGQASSLMNEEADFQGAVREAVADLRALSECARRAPAHRDLHDKQLIWHPAYGPALLDVDTACVADPALDIANLRGHALWRHRQGLWSAARADVVIRGADALADRLTIDDHAMEVYEQATLLRLGCVYAFRPKWSQTASELRRELGRL